MLYAIAMGQIMTFTLTVLRNKVLSHYNDGALPIINKNVPVLTVYKRQKL